MEANQDRQRLAAVLRTLADVLESESETPHLLVNAESGAWLQVFCDPENGEFEVYNLNRLELVSTKAAKLAGVEVAKAVGDE